MNMSEKKKKQVKKVNVWTSLWGGNLAVVALNKVRAKGITEVSCLIFACVALRTLLPNDACIVSGKSAATVKKIKKGSVLRLSFCGQK